MIKTVDGSGSGLDADKLDGQDGSYYQNASNLNAGTVPQARLSASDLLTLIKTVDGSGSGLDADKLDNQEGSYYRNASNLNSGTIPSARLSASDLLTLIKTVDGSGSGLDADKLDGQEGSFYRNADNLNSGSVSRARLSELGDVANPYICASKTNITQQWQIIYFGTAYTNAPKIVTTVDEAGRIARVTSITTTQFQVQREKANYPDFSFDAGYIYWIAYGNKA
ncbi:MAG: hypothetical protein GTO45_37760 [Candidatus Aminicenantes bacterium]|nr:hypothetical protein [Candidatus Aminicenantes bacterium]NIM84412.1 hypothetical protein [Candidatus Aminicenantes bacterium]NIN18526.1 hypothetical protein [Candidatus Aminicenantes bacterium]NIN42422.1 hypothetical protein [Candidatus Aminicenantes bacterium]NIN90536.1 hypothetical protein [Candidatus Aminicenantes bacterium]